MPLYHKNAPKSRKIKSRNKKAKYFVTKHFIIPSMIIKKTHSRKIFIVPQIKLQNSTFFVHFSTFIRCKIVAMKTLMNDEKFIRQSFSSNDIIFSLTRTLFLLHFQAVDAVERTAHSRAIYYLYIAKNRKLTKQGIADETYTNVRSLKREREKYTAYFRFFYHYIRNRNFTAESALASIL